MKNQKQAITENEEITALGYVTHNGVLHDQHDTCPYCQSEKKADVSREWAKSYERFRLFFIPAIDLDQVPPVKIYASEKDAWDCWKNFVQPLLAAQEQRIREKMQEIIGKNEEEKPEYKNNKIRNDLRGKQRKRLQKYLSDKPEKE